VQSLQLKQKTNWMCVPADSHNETVTNSLQPELELHIMKPSVVTLQTHNLLDPCERTPPHPKLQSGTSVEKWVRFQGGTRCFITSLGCGRLVSSVLYELRYVYVICLCIWLFKFLIATIFPLLLYITDSALLKHLQCSYDTAFSFTFVKVFKISHGIFEGESLPFL
jgi:hypothetical protein